mgnify:CR=1 FL=1
MFEKEAVHQADEPEKKEELEDTDDDEDADLMAGDHGSVPAEVQPANSSTTPITSPDRSARVRPREEPVQERLPRRRVSPSEGLLDQWDRTGTSGPGVEALRNMSDPQNVSLTAFVEDMYKEHANEKRLQ